ncbi:MAG: DUF1249 domain-containing protein [Gammaproteobacteria bacterium]|nr:DUF1249 domain-containing protein [Gammaproteobacteria bacterium]
MQSDQLCASSWRARPRSFVSLMTLYESNFIRLGWVVPDLRRLPAMTVAVAAGEPPLEIVVHERSRWTTTLELSCLFDTGGQTERAPRLTVRAYHDARLAEACGVAAATPAREADVPARRAPDHWRSNMLLNKWLEYCAGRGYQLAPAAS